MGANSSRRDGAWPKTGPSSAQTGCRERSSTHSLRITDDEEPVCLAMTVTIGLTVSPQHGEMREMRKCWTSAEQLGVDALYTADHFTAMIVDQDQATRTAADGVEYGKTQVGGMNFEGSTIEAAMAATTSRFPTGLA